MRVKLSKYFQDLQYQFPHYKNLSKKTGVSQSILRKYKRTGKIERKQYDKVYNTYRKQKYQLDIKAGLKPKEAREKRTEYIPKKYIDLYEKVHKKTRLQYYKKIKKIKKLWKKKYKDLDTSNWYHP